MIKKLLSLVLVMSILVGIGGVVADLNTIGTAIATKTSFNSQSSPNSAYLQADEIIPKDGSVVNEGRVRIVFSEEITLEDITNLEWSQYVTEGYPSHVDILLDVDGNDVFDSKKNLETGILGSGVDDVLVAEFAYNPNTNYVRGVPYTIPGDLNNWMIMSIAGSSNLWLYSACPGAPGSVDFLIDTLANWKLGKTRTYQCYPSGAGDGAGINATTKVYGIEIEVDGWVAQSSAYIDDITLNGEVIENFDPSQQQGVDGTVTDYYDFTISPLTISFGAIPYGLVDKLGDAVTIDATASSVSSPQELQIMVDVTSDTDSFFDNLMKFEIVSVWTDISTDPILNVDAMSTAIYNTKLLGNTASYGAGTKVATLTYTLLPPTP